MSEIEEWECDLCGDFFFERADIMADEEKVICHTCVNSMSMEDCNE